MIRSLVLTLPFAVLLSACGANDEPTADEAPASEPATSSLGQARLQLATGSPAGVAELTDSAGQVTVSVDLTGFPQGLHGLHLHMVGACEAPAFESAGGHLNPTGRQHGSENPAGAHLGDLPNITVDVSGTGTASAVLDGTRDEVLASLFDADGTAIVVHESADDYRTDPSGNSGDRIACGVLSRP